MDPLLACTGARSMLDVHLQHSCLPCYIRRLVGVIDLLHLQAGRVCDAAQTVEQLG
jgi:hypothetical protein